MVSSKVVMFPSAGRVQRWQAPDLAGLGGEAREALTHALILRLRTLFKAMEKAASAQDYERAAVVRDQIVLVLGDRP